MFDVAAADEGTTTITASASVDNPLLILFRDDLSAKFAADPLLNNPQAKRFLEETTQLFGLLRDLARYPKSADNEDERVYAYSKLMDFLGKLQRHDQYVKYAHGMSREMVQLGFHTEGAMALLLHARLLNCDTPADSAGAAAGASAAGASAAAAAAAELTATDPARLLPDSVSIRELIASTVNVQGGCHGDCLGAGGDGGGLLDELPLGGAEHFPRQSALARPYIAKSPFHNESMRSVAVQHIVEALVVRSRYAVRPHVKLSVVRPNASLLGMATCALFKHSSITLACSCECMQH